MPFIATTLGTQAAPHKDSSTIHSMVESIARAVIPAANPDFENLFPSVTLWWLEVDAQGIPQREIGFNSQGEPVVIGPFGKNYGYWTDSNMSFAVSESETVSGQAFQTKWSQCESQWR